MGTRNPLQIPHHNLHSINKRSKSTGGWGITTFFIMANQSTTTAGDVLLYIPNIIGYLRIALTLTSIVLMICSPAYWILAVACYVASFVGDFFDGMAARKYNQCSTFGGLTDMVTDRCSTTGLLCVLSREYSEEPTLVLVRVTTTEMDSLQVAIHFIFASNSLSLLPNHISSNYYIE